VRALLADPQRHWRVSQLADRVHLNPGNVHRSLAALLESGFLEREGEAYLVADPGSLLEAWAEAAAMPRERVSLPRSPS
jgi:DNA-binding IclR family transcriptional regulator